MSINFNIESTDEIIYNCSEFSSYGVDRYHLYSNAYVEKVNNQEYGTGYCSTNNNSIIVNKTALWGENYYSSLTFDNPVVAYQGWSSGDRFLLIDRYYFYYSSTGIAYLRTSGKDHYSGSYVDYDDYNGEIIYVSDIPDADVSKGLFIKLYDINHTNLNLYNGIMTYSQLRNIWDISTQLNNPVLFKYLSDNFRNGGIYTGNTTRGSYFGIYYITLDGKIKLVDERYIERNWAAYGVLAYSGRELIIPFVSYNEYLAALSATYKWNSQTIQQIDEYLNN